MQPVDNIAQVMQVLRRQMAENLDRLRNSGKLKGAAPPASAGSAGSVVRTASTLRQTVERRIKSIDADDPRFLEKATHGFVESVLLAEFGEGLVNDPEFRDLMVQVQSTMLADAEVANDLNRLTTRIRES